MTNETRQALVELWRVAECHTVGKKVSVRMVTRWARDLKHRFREDEARALLDKFRDATPTQNIDEADATGRKNHGVRTQLDANAQNVGRKPDATTRARSKGTTSYKEDPEETYRLFADEPDAEIGKPPKRRTKTRDLAAYEAIGLIWDELQPLLRVPVEKRPWRSKNIGAAEKLLAVLGSADAVLEAWRASCAVHGEASITLGRVIDDVNFGRIGPQAKEKTALTRGLSEPENFFPTRIEL